jgi:integrase/recombinase XerD
VCVNQQLVGLDEREKEVVQLWRSGDISPATMRNYIRWVRHFYAYCGRLSLDDAAELTLAGAWRFARSYVGPRTKGPICASTGRTAMNALHAWAFALGRLGATLPEWSPKRKQVLLSPILKEYCEFRRRHRGVAEGTLHLDIQDASTFLAVPRIRGRIVSRITVSDIDAFVTQQAEHYPEEPSPEYAPL